MKYCWDCRRYHKSDKCPPLLLTDVVEAPPAGQLVEAENAALRERLRMAEQRLRVAAGLLMEARRAIRGVPMLKGQIDTFIEAEEARRNG